MLSTTSVRDVSRNSAEMEVLLACVSAGVRDIIAEDLLLVKNDPLASQREQIHLSKSKHPGRRDKAWPEIFPNMFDSVDPDAVDIVVRHQFLDPVVQGLDYLFIFCVEVWKRKTGIPEPAFLDVCLVVVVGDEALGVVV